MARNKAISELFRVPFSLYIFFLGYLIYRLVCLSEDIDHKRDVFKTDLMKVCITTENATNFVLSLQNTITTDGVEALANITNAASNKAVDSLRAVVHLGSKLFVLYVRYKTSSFRCVSIAALQMGTDAFIDNQGGMDNFVNTQLAATVKTTNALFKDAVDGLNSAATYVNGYLSDFQSVAAQLQANNISLSAPNVVVPTLSYLIIPNVTFPNTTGWTAPDYTADFNNLLNLANPLNYAESALDNITNFGNVSAQQLMQELGVDNLPIYQVSFCSQFNLTVFDEVVDGAIDGVYVCIGIVSFIILVLLVWNGSMVIHHHYKGSYWRPSWAPHGGTLEKFLIHVWHKPSMTCLLIGLLGIAIFKGLELGTQDAKQSYIANVLIPVEVSVNDELDVIGAAFDKFSLDFANAINSGINQTESVYLTVRGQLTSAVQTLVNVQQQANTQLNYTFSAAVLGYSAELIQLVDCLVPLLTMPLTDLFNLIPQINNFPVVGDRDLTFNRTKAKLLVSGSLNKTVYPFDWYIQKLEQEVTFYYYLTAYGTPVFLIGLIFAVRDFHKNRQNPKVIVHSEAPEKQFRV